MTTIAYKDGFMASDTQMTNGNRKLFGIRKVFATQSFIVGIGGAVPMIDPVLAWFLDAEINTADHGVSPEQFHSTNPPDFCSTDIQILAVCRETRMAFELDATGHGVRLGEGFAALGSGAEYALGAMAAGASAREAVEIAAAMDIHTGGVIEVVDVRGSPDIITATGPNIRAG